MGAFGNRARWLSLTGAALIGGLAASPAASAATYETSVSPTTISWPESADIDNRLRVTTGAQSERLVIAATAPGFYEGTEESSGAFMALDNMRLEGPGTVVDRSRADGIYDSFCSNPLPIGHGNTSSSTREFLTVEIPANSTSTIAAKARTTYYSQTPWLGTPLGATFRVFDRNENGSQPQFFRSPSPKNTGKHGVRISLQSDPKGGPGYCGPLSQNEWDQATKVEFGTGIRFTGKADPEVAGRMMTLRTPETDLANVPIGADGSFSYLWQPSAPGNYIVGALYRSQSPKFVDDYSDSAYRFTVGPRPQADPPPATATPAETTGRAPFSSALLPSVTGARCLTGACRHSGAAKARQARSRGSTYRVAVRGRYRKRPCGGKVRLTYRVSGTRTLTRTATIGPNCRYRKTLRLRVSRRTRIGATLRISQRFTGTKTVTAGNGQTLEVKLRRR